jgi:hypothetical protein
MVTVSRWHVLMVLLIVAAVVAIPTLVEMAQWLIP